MWTCARCGQAHPAYLMKCGVCGGDRLGMTAVAVQGSAPAPPCPSCGGGESRRVRPTRLRCETCGHEHEDYEEWVRQCRAAAFAARDHRPPPPRPPPPAPPGLNGVALALSALSPLYALAASARVEAPWIHIALGLAGLQLLSGVALLARHRHALAATRWSCGLTSIAPLAGFHWVYVAFFVYACRPDARRFFEGEPRPASPRALAGGLGVVAALMLSAAAVHLTWVREEVATARAWGVPLPPLLEAAGRLHDARGYAAGLSLLTLALVGVLGRVSRRGFAWAATLAGAGAVVAGAVPGAQAVAHRGEVRRAEALGLDADATSLVAALGDADPKLRRTAARALRRLAPPAAVAGPVLRRALEDPVASVRFAAALALARIDPEAEAAAPVLLAGLDAHAGEALDGLYLLGPRARAALPALLARLPIDDRSMPALEEIGAAALPGLTQALSHAEAAARRRAAAVLGRLGPTARSAGAALVDRMDDPDPGVRDAATRAVADVLQEKAVPLLQARADDPSAAAGLCALGVRDGLRSVVAVGPFLNAVRTPAHWDHLRRTGIDRRMEGSGLELVHRIAERALLCAEVGPVAEKLPALKAFHRVHADARRRTALDVLRSLGVDFVLEEGRLRILDPVEAHHFWTGWAASRK